MPVVFIFRGNVAFITGGGSGIGFRIAEILMRYFTVILLCTAEIQSMALGNKLPR